MKSRVGASEKTAEDEGKSSGESSGQAKDQGQQEPPKGPKPLTKWQKIGYAAFGVLMTGGIIINSITFCEFFIHHISFHSLAVDSELNLKLVSFLTVKR